ncbi:terpene cyclase/mutase family protein [Paenarthrobacter sp. MSM-2-10-13]|uniref:prenyltransferase/squalene oxidase repeat-containing protein n=1 Tax=Paenarthrobacter sp. MSM-2-10-13 TaxID=2717318 RepID=UPI001420B7CD|nr:prenyltransferase/squalene oxidase repeat-containing protein [Paenarthrobacter sp. MSM-2-10-13]NHW47386.1 terpene cyclase/mutase family protein [Paenarthrobacter sp. MSM-2-10-13]
MSNISMEVSKAAAAGLALAVSRDFYSADPYDGLSSPVAKLLNTKLTRQAWIQVLKRSGEGTRRLVGVKPVRMAKSLALFAMAAKELGDINLANSLVDDLLHMGSGRPWGYEFDVQTRWAYYPQGTPNVVATTFAIRAIDSVGRTDEVSPAIGKWLRNLYDKRGYFYYTDTSDKLVHNGSLLAAESLGRLGLHEELVQKAITKTISHQRPDGGWAYGDAPGLEWEDSFHTVYVIDSLTELGRRGFLVDEAPTRGLRHWKESFFTNSGEPKYFAGDTTSTREIHNNATVLGAIADYGSEMGLSELKPSVLRVLLSTQDSNGAFRSSPRGPLFLRWNQGHAVLALAKLAKRDAVAESN